MGIGVLLLADWIVPRATRARRVLSGTLIVLLRSLNLARARAVGPAPAALRRALHAGDRMPVLTDAERSQLAMRLVGSGPRFDTDFEPHDRQVDP